MYETRTEVTVSKSGPTLTFSCVIEIENHWLKDMKADEYFT